ncbi:unnamed protein product [Anisakis simplex]|uniref:Guanine nucleotide-binding protein subunit gamma 2-like n=1 Tax=Anisakis simplex TaxID=6269 RepID=A0A0M3J9S4_ANISI|nr:unnamed protein product [Anisakis simplex]
MSLLCMMEFSARKALENRMDVDHDRCMELEQKLREAQSLLTETETKSDEVCAIDTNLLSVFNNAILPVDGQIFGVIPPILDIH